MNDAEEELAIVRSTYHRLACEVVNKVFKITRRYNSDGDNIWLQHSSSSSKRDRSEDRNSAKPETKALKISLEVVLQVLVDRFQKAKFGVEALGANYDESKASKEALKKAIDAIVEGVVTYNDI